MTKGNNSLASIQTLADAVSDIKRLMHEARSTLAIEVNQVVLQTNWKIGRIIVEIEQSGDVKARYGGKLLTEISKQLTEDLGKGFSRRNLSNMRQFYNVYPIWQTLSAKLSWSHSVSNYIFPLQTKSILKSGHAKFTKDSWLFCISLLTETAYL